MITVKETAGKAKKVARSVWLAGFGVCSKNLDTAQSGMEKSSVFFDKLVVRGEKLEGDAKLQLKDSKAELKAKSEKVQKQYDDVLAKSKKTFSEYTDIDSLKVKMKDFSGAGAKLKLKDAKAALKTRFEKVQKQYDDVLAKSKETFSEYTDMESLKVKIKDFSGKAQKVVKA